MDRTAYINLPVQDLAATTGFFTALGFTFDARVGDANTSCMVVGNGALVMLHTTAFFEQFTAAAVADPSTKEVAVGLSAASREEVDELTERAVAAGGKDAGAQDTGFLYMRAFLDLDGHRWSFLYFAN
jgi:predicted lactoylglutathione lyase